MNCGDHSSNLQLCKKWIHKKVIRPEELEGINKKATCAEKDNQNQSGYNIKGEEKTLSTSENKKMHDMVMFIYMNEVKNLHFNLRTHVRITGNDHQSDEKSLSHSVLRQKNYVQ